MVVFGAVVVTPFKVHSSFFHLTCQRDVHLDGGAAVNMHGHFASLAGGEPALVEHLNAVLVGGARRDRAVGEGDGVALERIGVKHPDAPPLLLVLHLAVDVVGGHIA